MEEQTLEVVGEIGQTDLGRGPLETDGTGEQAHALLLVGKDVLDGCANGRVAGVGPSAIRGIGRPSGFLQWEVGDPALASQASLTFEQ